MEKSSFRGRVLTDIESLISRSCAKSKMNRNFKHLHEVILKKHYNAADVTIDYHRKRIEMEIVMDDTCFDPQGVNMNVPTLHVNLLFKNLCDFLKSCLESDRRSLAFYAGLVRRYSQAEIALTSV